MVWIFYHDKCSDGYGAMYVVRYALLLNNFRSEDIKAVPVSYGDDITCHIENMSEENTVFIVDFSFTPDILDLIANKVKDVILIDHHISAINMLKDYNNPKVSVNLDKTKSGTGLSWDICFPNNSRPIMVNHIEDRDLYGLGDRSKYNFSFQDTKRVITGLLLDGFNIENYNKHFFVEQDDLLYKELYNAGKTVEKYIGKEIDNLLNSKLEIVDTLFGKAGIINTPNVFTSDLLNTAIKKYNLDYALAYNYFKDKITISFRSHDEGTNVEHLAKAYFNGGGHRNSSGGYLVTTNVMDLFDTLGVKSGS